MQNFDECSSKILVGFLCQFHHVIYRIFLREPMFVIESKAFNDVQQ
jgi:hypothetical protein